MRAAAALLGLDPYLARKPKALSGGQRQRVAVGRAIVRQPKVFLFDEPLSNLDAKMRAATRAELSKLHARLGVTMIYVTHDQVEAMTMGDRICVMKDGRIMQVAEPLELYHRPNHRFVAGFIGSPPMNLLDGRIERAEAGWEFCEDAGSDAVRPGGAGTAPAPDGGSGARLRIPLTGELERIASGWAGRAVTFGLRPEDVHETTGAEWGEGRGPVVTARLELAETMGAETHLHFRTATTVLIARVRAAGRPALNQPMRLGLDLSRAHWFDGVSGAVLGRDGATPAG
jgi:multiple sugar transport system ATP-binding protein